MKIYKWPLKEDEREKIKEALKKGEVIVYPTDTVYGIGGVIHKKDVADRIYLIKEREKDKGLPILFNDKNIIERYAELNYLAKALANAFWPGALTLVVPLKKKELMYLTGSKNKIAVRIPSGDIIKTVISLAGGALIGTSANISGFPPCQDVKCVIKQLNKKVDIIIDGGHLGSGRPSTIVEIVNEKKVKIIREGDIKREEIENILKEI